MKRLYIIRHAKAEEHSLDKRDYDRDLIDRGKERAHRIANELISQLTIDDNTLVISSSANRAYQTAEIFCQILGHPIAQIHQEKGFYHAYHLEILEAINQVPDTINTILIFGHNPGLSMLAMYLSNQHVDLRTCSVAYLELVEGLRFAELSEGTAHLKKVFD